MISQCTGTFPYVHIMNFLSYDVNETLKTNYIRFEFEETNLSSLDHWLDQ